jgi:hypothetical protein
MIGRRKVVGKSAQGEGGERGWERGKGGTHCASTLKLQERGWEIERFVVRFSQEEVSERKREVTHRVIKNRNVIKLEVGERRREIVNVAKE